MANIQVLGVLCEIRCPGTTAYRWLFLAALDVFFALSCLIFLFFQFASPFWLQLQPWICDFTLTFHEFLRLWVATVHLSLPLRRFSRVSTSNFSRGILNSGYLCNKWRRNRNSGVGPNTIGTGQFGRVGIKSEAKCLILICVNHDIDELKILNDIHCCL